MWVRKTPEDIAGERKKLWLAFSEPSIVFIVFFIIGLIFELSSPTSESTHLM
jgi:hypothetical protein